ncbi:MAG: Na+/H+ antiporter subunit E [Candidatus Methanospirareceae archaeon]
MEGRGEKEIKERNVKKMRGFIGAFVIFCIMYIFWLLLSNCISPRGIDVFREIGGVICSFIVVVFSYKHNLLRVEWSVVAVRKAFRFLFFLPWLLWQIAIANLDITYRVLHPRMPIDPRVIEFDTPLRSDLARTTLANSITLTPGTITIEVKGGRFLVHAISKKHANALLVEKKMQKKVAYVYMEGSTTHH